MVPWKIDTPPWEFLYKIFTFDNRHGKPRFQTRVPMAIFVFIRSNQQTTSLLL